MLDSFRRGASKIFVTILFSLLIFSFALWGIPNYSRTGGDQTLAQVGEARVTEEEFRRFFDQQLNVLSQQAGQRLTRENARLAYKLQQLQQGNFNADLDREILNLQISQAALDQKAKDMGLRLPDATIVEAIRTDPSFVGADKKFSRSVFEERIRSVGLSDVGYIRERKANELREQITESIASGLTPSQTLIEIAHKFQEEKRSVAFFILDPAKQAKPAEPDEAKLKEFYEQSKRQFIAPERRKLNVLFLSREDIKERAKVEESEVKAAWEKSKESWNIPERRRIQQIAFRSRDAAAAVAKEIQGGKSFLMAALEENGAQGRLDQGLLPRQGIGDPKVAAAAFALALNQLSEPIEGRSGVLLIRVTEIEPGRVRGFEEVAKEVRDDLEQKKQRDTLTRLTEQIEDLRGAGKSLRQIADEVKIKVLEGLEMNRAGQGADGKPALTHPDAQKIIQSGFEGAKEAPRDMIELSDGGGEAWVEVAAVIAEAQKPFEEVKAEVKTLWTEAEARKKLAEATQGLIDKIKGGMTFEAVAKLADAKIETSQPFTRNGQVPGLSPAAIRQAFTLPKGGVAASETADNKSRMLLVVTDIKVADPPTKEEADRLKRLIEAQLQSDARTIYVSALRNRIGVSIDEKAFQRLVGAEVQR